MIHLSQLGLKLEKSEKYEFAVETVERSMVERTAVAAAEEWPADFVHFIGSLDPKDLWRSERVGRPTAVGSAGFDHFEPHIDLLRCYYLRPGSCCSSP